MEHLFHPFIPGTPENLALMALWPSLLPFFHQVVAVLRSWRHAPIRAVTVSNRPPNHPHGCSHGHVEAHDEV